MLLFIVDCLDEQNVYVMMKSLLQSPAEESGKIRIGAEIIQINQQNVVCDSQVADMFCPRPSHPSTRRFQKKGGSHVLP